MVQTAALNVASDRYLGSPELAIVDIFVLTLLDGRRLVKLVYDGLRLEFLMQFLQITSLNELVSSGP